MTRSLPFVGALLLGCAAAWHWFQPTGRQLPASVSGGEQANIQPQPVAAPVLAAGPGPSAAGLIGQWQNLQSVGTKDKQMTWDTVIAFEKNGHYQVTMVIDGTTTIRHAGTWRRDGERVVYSRATCKWEGRDLGREACPNMPSPAAKATVRGDTLDLQVEMPEAPVRTFQRVSS